MEAECQKMQAKIDSVREQRGELRRAQEMNAARKAAIAEMEESLRLTCPDVEVG